MCGSFVQKKALASKVSRLLIVSDIQSDNIVRYLATYMQF